MDSVGYSVAVAHKATRRARKGKLARCWLVVIALVIVNLCFVKTYSVAGNNYKPTHYKQYILQQLNDFQEAYCLVELYSKENSQWDPKVRNGSHIGIPQGRSEYLATVNGVKQIDWGIKYINNRYGSMCKALQHFKIKGWH